MSRLKVDASSQSRMPSFDASGIHACDFRWRLSRHPLSRRCSRTRTPSSTTPIARLKHFPTMPLLRSASRLLTSPRAHLHIVSPSALRSAQRTFTSSAVRSSDAHEEHYDPPSGYLWGVKPGEKYENEGWENVWFYGFFGSLAFGVVGYAYKPDTRYVLDSIGPSRMVYPCFAPNSVCLRGRAG